MSSACVPHHDWFTAFLTFGLCCGLVVSYLPQHIRIINKGSSEGFSPWFLLLGSTSSAAGFLNIAYVGSPCNGALSDAVQLFLGTCLELTAGVVQLGLQWGLFTIILVLYMMYYPDLLKYVYYILETDDPRSPVYVKSTIKKPEWRLSIILAWVVVIHLALITFTSFFLLFTVPTSPDPDTPLPDILSKWATFLGVSSALLAAIQYAPQLIHTYRSKIVGALSIPMMCIQSPGAILMVLSIALRPGTNWTSWITFAVAGTMQGSLLAMCIVFHFRQRRLGLDEFGNPLPDHAVDSDTPVLEGIVLERGDRDIAVHVPQVITTEAEVDYEEMPLLGTDRLKGKGWLFWFRRT